MAESEARKRSREAKGTPAPAGEKPPLQITLLGHDVVLDAFDLTIDEKQTWRRYAAELGANADEADLMMALAVVLIQRADPDLTWTDAKGRVTWRMMLDAVKAGHPVEADHPQ